MNAAIAFAIHTLASLIIGTDIFYRIEAAVNRWAEKEIDSASKKEGVLAELEVIGLNLSKSLANLGIELAVQLVKRKAD